MYRKWTLGGNCQKKIRGRKNTIINRGRRRRRRRRRRGRRKRRRRGGRS